jgi:hypothetical protein
MHTMPTIEKKRILSQNYNTRFWYLFLSNFAPHDASFIFQSTLRGEFHQSFRIAPALDLKKINRFWKVWSCAYSHNVDSILGSTFILHLLKFSQSLGLKRPRTGLSGQLEFTK